MFDPLVALQRWWTNTPEAVALTGDGKLWFREGPEEPSGDFVSYATFFLVADLVEIQTTDYAVKRATIQVSFHAATSAEASTMAQRFAKLARTASLEDAGQTAAHCLPDGGGLDLGEGFGPGGSDCWIAYKTLDVLYTS